MERIILYFLVGGLAYLVYQVFSPFLIPLAWAAILVIFSFPLHRRLQQSVSGPSRAALASTLLLALILIAPVLVVTATAASQAIDVAKWFQVEWKKGRRPIMEWVQGKPLEAASEWLPANVEKEQLEGYIRVKLQALMGAVAAGAGRMAGMVASTLFYLFLMLFAAFYFFRDGPRSIDLLRQVLPLDSEQRELFFSIMHNTIYASLFSSFVVAVVQGALGGIVFALLGISRPVLWGIIMAFLSLIPVLGAWMVWVPVAIIFIATGQWMKAVVLIVVGFVVIGMADNVLRPILISGRAEMNGLLVFVSVLGGIAVFGLLGVVLGPLLVALSMAVVETYASTRATET